MRPSILFLLFFTLSDLNSQELIANGGFENYNICTEYNAPCAPEAWFRLPPTEINVKLKKVPRVYEGKYAELVVVENEKNPVIYRVFLYTQLLCPLIQGQEYTLNFFFNPVSVKRYQLDVLLTEQELISDLVNPLAFSATRVITDKDEIKKNRKSNWRQIEVTFMAKGGEKFLTFGNFSKEATFLEGKTKANNNQGDLVFLLDNVSLTANDPAYSSCPEMEETRRLLYATNHRHTYKKGIERNLEPEEVISPPLPPIEEVEDTTITAAPLPTTFEIPGVAFDFDLHRLKPDYLPALDSFAVVIQKMGWNQIQVLGHTDNIGEDDYNLELSARRAEAVKHYLDKKLAGKEVIILAEGKGECCPKANNDTEENRARNRRVEIIPQTE